MTSSKGKRKELIGAVTSDKMDKTVVVKVQRTVQHPVYKRIVRRFSKFKAHNKENKARLGDKVRLRETRPLSKEKRWAVVEIFKDDSAKNHL